MRTRKITRKNWIGVTPLVLKNYDCTANGVTKQFDFFYLIKQPTKDEGGDYTKEELADFVKEHQTISSSLLFVETLLYGFDETRYVRAIPYENIYDRNPKVNYMAGGNFVYTSDSSYRDITGVEYPISVHDRRERYNNEIIFNSDK
jgi:hypothetical protein